VACCVIWVRSDRFGFHEPGGKGQPRDEREEWRFEESLFCGRFWIFGLSYGFESVECRGGKSFLVTVGYRELP